MPCSSSACRCGTIPGNWAVTINEEMRAHFLASAIRSFVGPGQSIEGWMFTTLDRGVKAINVDLIGARRLQEFFFMVQLSDLRADYQDVDQEKLYPLDQIRDVDENALRAALEEMPCCATTYDPLNFVSSARPTRCSARTGWHVAEVLHTRSALKTAWSYFLRWPVSVCADQLRLRVRSS